MIKRISLIKRLPGQTPEQFAEHWGTVHADLARRLPGLRRYVQNLFVSGDALGCDGISELWFDDEEAARAASLSPAADATTADRPNFLGELVAQAIFVERVVVE